MQAWARTGRRARALAVVALATLALAITPGLSSAHTHPHAARGAAVLLAATDTAHGNARADTHGVAATPPAVVRIAARSAATSDPSPAVRSRTAQTPQVRGPPGQALA